MCRRSGIGFAIHVTMLCRLALVAALASCGQESIGVSPSPAADYNHKALVTAIDKFVAAGRTPEAYGELAHTVSALRPGMDKAVAQEAERKLVVLALGPAKTVAAKPPRDQLAALALTVWPILLAPPIEADALLQLRDPKAALLFPKPGEDPDQYLERLCGGPLASDCKHVVPEDQGLVVEALAVRRATERVRTALTECLECQGESADPRWHQAVLDWEQLDRTAAETLPEIERRSGPDNWPVAGAAADDDPALPEAEISRRGEILVGGHAYGPNQLRLDVLRELRGTGDAIALHLQPATSLAEVRAMLVDARRAGCGRVAVIAREGFYPWRRRAYWIAAGSGLRASLRPTDSLQLLLHAIDEVAGPGTVARVD
jgi:hypothetical protein